MPECSIYIYMVNYVCVYKRVQMKTRLKRTGTWSAAKLPSRRLCYPNSILPSPSPTFFPLWIINAREIWDAFWKCIYSIFYFSKGVILKLHKLNLRQYNSVYHNHLKHLSVQNTGKSRLMFCGMLCCELELIIITRLSKCALLLGFQQEYWLSTVH